MASKEIKPRLLAVRFTKRQLMSLPKNERELLLRVGLLMNDILLYQRLWMMMIYRDPKSAIAKEVHAIQSATMLLALVGKTFEALEVFERRFLSSEVGRDYLPSFSKSHRMAVDYLKTLRGSGSFFADIRNTYAFHYHDDDLTPFIESMADDRVLNAYLGAPDGNTLNSYAAEPFLHSLMALTGETKPVDALNKIQVETGKAIGNLFQWTAGVQIAALRKMHGRDPPVEDYKIGDDEYLPQDQTRFPFFMSVPTKKKT